MKKHCYVLSSLLVGWLVYWLFPIQEPAIIYFLGTIIGVLALFMIPNKEITHNVVHQSILWSVLILVFQSYIVVGLAIGIGTHIVLDYVFKLKKQINLQFGLYTKLICTFSLILANTGVVVSVVLNKFLNY